MTEGGLWLPLWKLHNDITHDGYCCTCVSAPILHCGYCDDEQHQHPANCPVCDTLMYCIRCHIGGGSHYWTLRCDKCSKLYYYDTYRFELEMVTTTYFREYVKA